MDFNAPDGLRLFWSYVKDVTFELQNYRFEGKCSVGQQLSFANPSFISFGELFDRVHCHECIVSICSVNDPPHRVRL